MFIYVFSIYTFCLKYNSVDRELGEELDDKRE